MRCHGPTALALRRLFPNDLERFSMRTETINNREHFGKVEMASRAPGNFPVRGTSPECDGTASLRVHHRTRREEQPAKVSLFHMAPPGECDNAGCDRVLTSPCAIQYLMPQAGHREQVSPKNGLKCVKCCLQNTSWLQACSGTLQHRTFGPRR